jgi:hypothetical protein
MRFTAASTRNLLERLWLGQDEVVAFLLVYVDECEVHAHPHLEKVWQKYGSPMEVPAAGEDHNFVVFGALDYASGRIVYHRSEQKGSDGTTVPLVRC